MRGGSHFCQSLKGKALGGFWIKRKGGLTLFPKEIPKFSTLPSLPPPKKKRTFPYTLKFIWCVIILTKNDKSRRARAVFEPTTFATYNLSKVHRTMSLPADSQNYVFKWPFVSAGMCDKRKTWHLWPLLTKSKQCVHPLKYIASF